MWARSVCINESLLTGSMIPQIEDAKKNGMDVLVMNPNYNRDPKTNVNYKYDLLGYHPIRCINDTTRYICMAKLHMEVAP